MRLKKWLNPVKTSVIRGCSAPPENVQKKFKKNVDAPLAFWDIAVTHGNNRTTTLNKMRTKTLLMSAAALLAAGIVSSQAQSPVYSQNIVGYVTQTLPIGWASVDTPLDLSGGNTLTNIFPNPAPGGPGTGPLDFDLVYIWNGAGYTAYTLDTDFPTGVANAGDNTGVTAPTINPGTLIFIHNNGGNVAIPTTNALTGTVHVDGVANFVTTFVGTTTNALVPGYNYVASKLPVAGGFTSVLQLTNPVVGGNGGPNGGTGPLDFSLVYIPNIVNGNFLGYTTYTIDSDFSTGWANAGDNTAVPEPQIPVGLGIIIKYANNNAINPYYWVQQY